MILTDAKERSRFLRFAMVGIIGAVVDFGVANLLIWLFNTTLVIAGTVSFLCAVVSNFLWNRFWTYPDSRSKNVARQLVMFTVVSMLGLGIRILLLSFIEVPLIGLSEQIFGSSFFLTPEFIGKNTSLAVAILVVMMWNFFANRYWTYNDVK